MGSSYIGHVDPNYGVHGAPNDGFDENTTTITMNVEDSTTVNAAKKIDKPMFEIGEITITLDADDSTQASAAKEIDKPILETGNTTITITMDAEDSAQANAAKEIDKPMFEIGEITITTTDAEDSTQASTTKEIGKPMLETGNTTITITTDAEDSAQASAAKEIDKHMFEIGFIIFILVVQGVKWILFMLRGGGNSLYMNLALLVLDVVILVSLGIKGCSPSKRGKNRCCCCELTWSGFGYGSLLIILQVARIVLTILRSGAKEGKTLLLDVGMGAIDVALVALMLFKFFCV